MIGAGHVWIISGASGAGKTTLIDALLDDPGGLEKSVSYTTRVLRGNEQAGRAYYPVSTDEFNRMVEADAFLEYAEVHGNWYGTPKQPVLECARAGREAVLEIDWQGAEQVRRCIPDVNTIFILPPDLPTLHRRLLERGQDAPDVIEQRLRNAVCEIQQARSYDHCVINDDFDRVREEIKQIIMAVRAGHGMKDSETPARVNSWLTANHAEGNDGVNGS